MTADQLIDVLMSKGISKEQLIALAAAIALRFINPQGPPS